MVTEVHNAVKTTIYRKNDKSGQLLYFVNLLFYSDIGAIFREVYGTEETNSDCGSDNVVVVVGKLC